MKLAIEFYDAWEAWGIDGGVKALKEAGFEAMDMSYYYAASAYFLGEDYREKALAVKATLEKYGLGCTQAHGPIEMRYGMAQDDSEPAYVRLKRAIESAAIIGIDHIVVEGMEVPAPSASYLNLDYNCAYYRKLEPLAKEFGIVIAIENLKKAFTYPDAMNEVLRRLDSPWFAPLVDVGHSWVRADMQPGAYIRQLERPICGLHVHDTHGVRQGEDEHLLPWLCELDYGDMLAALREAGYQGDMTLELRGFLLRYAEHGLLLPALQFAAAVGRRLIDYFQNPDKPVV